MALRFDSAVEASCTMAWLFEALTVVFIQLPAVFMISADAVEELVTRSFRDCVVAQQAKHHALMSELQKQRKGQFFFRWRVHHANVHPL